MTVSYNGMLLAHLGVVMTEFNAFKTPVHCNNHAGHTLSGRPPLAVLLHSDLYIHADIYNVWSFTSMLPIYLDGMVLTHRYCSVGKQNAIGNLVSILCGTTTEEWLNHGSDHDFPVTVTESHVLM
jgi:hypothetical protein